MIITLTRISGKRSIEKCGTDSRLRNTAISENTGARFITDAISPLKKFFLKYSKYSERRNICVSVVTHFEKYVSEHIDGPIVITGIQVKMKRKFILMKFHIFSKNNDRNKNGRRNCGPSFLTPFPGPCGVYEKIPIFKNMGIINVNYQIQLIF